jgi:hypothetical protein
MVQKEVEDGGYELIKSDDNAVLAESRMVIIERY